MHCHPQYPLSMGFSWQEHWSGFPCPPPGDLLDPGIKPTSLTSPHWQAGSSPLVPPRKPNRLYQNSETKTSFHRTRQLEGAHKQSGLVPSLSKQENSHLTKPVALPGPPARQRLKVAADVVQREGGSNPGRSRSLQSTVTGDPSFTLTVCFCFQFSESVYKFQLSPLRGLSWGLGGRHPLPTLHTVQGTRAGLGCSELDM